MEASYAAVAAELARDEPICATTHESPDGDALGSLLGAALSLRAAGRDVAVYLAGAEPLPHEYGFLPLENIDRELPPDIASRTLWAFDCGSAARIERAAQTVTRARRVVNVDHHHDNTLFGAVNLVDPSAACTAQMVGRLLAGAGIALTAEAAVALYVGVVTDTGRFQYPNTSPAALRFAADLIERGVDVARIFAAIWESVPLAKQRLLGVALERARSEVGGRLVVSWLDRDDYAAAGAEDPYSEGVIDQLRAVEGVEVAALVREPRDRNGPQRKISLRSSAGGVDVSAIARKRGGGGHVGAAGFSSDDSVEVIVDFLRAELEAAEAPA